MRRSLLPYAVAFALALPSFAFAGTFGKTAQGFNAECAVVENVDGQSFFLDRKSNWTKDGFSGQVFIADATVPKIGSWEPKECAFAPRTAIPDDMFQGRYGIRDLPGTVFMFCSFGSPKQGATYVGEVWAFEPDHRVALNQIRTSPDKLGQYRGQWKSARCTDR